MELAGVPLIKGSFTWFPLKGSLEGSFWRFPLKGSLEEFLLGVPFQGAFKGLSQGSLTADRALAKSVCERALRSILVV